MDILHVAKEYEITTSNATEPASTSEALADVENAEGLASEETVLPDLPQNPSGSEFVRSDISAPMVVGAKRKRNSLHQCGDCGKNFSTSSNLHQHERLCHSLERKLFECGTCRKLFSTTSNLYQHQRTHTGERPFGCTTCGRAFATSTNLRQHERTHTGEKPFVCSVCNKAFATSTNLRQHQRTHTGEKPFTCTECGKAFASSTNLRQHVRSHLRHRLCITTASNPPRWVALSTVANYLGQALVQGTQLCQETGRTVVVNILSPPPKP